MKLELKAIKYSEFASQETYCYQAKLYVNGKPFAFVENDGHGGCDNVYPLDNLPREDIPAWRENLNVIEAHLKAEQDSCLEFVCCDLVTQWLREKEAKRILRKICYIKMDGQVYSLPAKHKPTDVNLAQLKMSKGWDHAWILLNDLPKARAVELILRSFDGQPHPMA